jgi:stress response protein YsnF
MEENKTDIVVPVITEEAHASAKPFETGGVRVTKRVEGHDEVLEQELHRGRVEVKRVKMNRVVDGPQPVQRSGSTVIVPVVSEVLHVERQWVVTEEIHISQIEERETVQQKVTVSEERASVERLDERGNPIETIEATPEPLIFSARRPAGVIERTENTPTSNSSGEGILSSRQSLIKRVRNRDRTK